MSDLCFRVLDWDFFAPDMDKKFILDNINNDIKITYGDTNPDLDFIPRAQKRRLSQITKLSFESVKNILKENEQMPIFFVSKYGEIKQQYNISKKIVTEHEVSPALFSFSVFNTAVAQLTIFYQNHERAIAVTCYDNFIDTALVQAMAFLKTSNHNEALIIIADERLPESYEEISKDINYSFACSFLISKDNPNICIDMLENDTKKDENSIIDFIKFISTDSTNLKLGKIELTKR
ncbi:beta-ketoacyl synthase chain length factor [Brachyspira pulli]|uniref:beta-ketoacyl synthase chain length factor n=1 Tax=Brachyspira pulli TaxID=310721 RepID=UPI0030060EEE